MSTTQDGPAGQSGEAGKDNGQSASFSGLGLSQSTLKSLSAMGYSEPTPIQRKAIPIIMEGRDVLGLAQTGTGKTAAFGLPLVQKLQGVGSAREGKSVRALILSPTRELASQIAEALKMFTRNAHLKVALAVGGQSINTQQRRLEAGSDILVATPGRLLDLVERKAVFLDRTGFLVLDEADQMLDLGFIHALRRIAKMVPPERQTLLFSATMPKEIAKLAEAFLTDPVRVEAAPPGKTADRVRQSVYHVARRAKPELLASLLEKQPNDISIVFARTKHGAERLKRMLSERGFDAASIHGNKSQSQRDRAIHAFKAGDINILVATDVAARGIDIPGVTHVYNFDLPEVPAQYVHRIGRTARAGEDGDAVAFCSPEEAHLLKAIEKQLGMAIPVLGDLPQPGGEGAQEAKPPRKPGSEHRKGAGREDGKKRNRRRKPGKKADGEAAETVMRDKSAAKPQRRRRKPAGARPEAGPQQQAAGDGKPAQRKDASQKKRRSKPRRWQRGRKGTSSRGGTSS